MEKLYEDFLKVYGLGMQGKSCEERIDATEEFFKLAGEQQVLETVCVGLGWRVPSEVRLRALKRIGFNDNKMRAAFSLIRLLEENGISACVLKGEAVASLYGTPECRISGDVDIFVGERISESVAVLEKAGCDFPRKDTPKHLVCRHPQAGIIELHDRLVSDTYLDLFFENTELVTEPQKTVKTRFGEIKALGVTDDLLFLLCHFIGHFISTCGIRQVSDILVYMSYYKEEINWQRFWETVKRLRYYKLICSLIGIGKMYMGFGDGLPEAEYDAEVIEELLNDIFKRPLFDKTVSGKNTRNELMRRRYEIYRSGEFGRYRISKGKENAVKIFFLDNEKLKLKYKYVEKSSLFVPVAWLHRALEILSRRIKRLASRSGSYKNEEIDNEKISLAKRLDMID